MHQYPLNVYQTFCGANLKCMEDDIRRPIVIVLRPPSKDYLETVSAFVETSFKTCSIYSWELRDWHPISLQKTPQDDTRTQEVILQHLLHQDEEQVKITY
jgi:hypothetical protein